VDPEGSVVTSDLGAFAPKYQRVANDLRRRIRQGEWQPGDRLPAETALAEHYDLSVPTMRQAVAVLRAEGAVESRHGIGTFVKEERRLQRRSRDRYGRARKDSRLLTAHLEHTILSAGRGPLPAHIAAVLDDAESGDEVVVRRRLLTDPKTGQPEEVGASYVPLDIAAGTFLEEPTVVPKAMFLCVEELSGKRYSQARDHWIARLPSAEESQVLGLPTGAPVMHVVHVARADDGSVLEVSESVWPADRIMLIDEYPVEPEAAMPEAPSEI
jgi:GntR family transcriptional regulator